MLPLTTFDGTELCALTLGLVFCTFALTSVGLGLSERLTLGDRGDLDLIPPLLVLGLGDLGLCCTPPKSLPTDFGFGVQGVTNSWPSPV